MDKEIYLIRHTTPDIDKGVCYGFTDVKTAGTFAEEVKVVQQKLRDVQFTHFYSSPLLRCRNLAEKIFSASVVLDKRLKELNFGSMEMTPYDQVDREWLSVWMDDFVNIPCPQGESFLQLQQRVCDFYYELLPKDETVTGICTHGGVIRSLICKILDIPLKKAFQVVYDWGGITKLEIKEGLVKVAYINR